jgi:hypothetical protein
MSGYAANVLSPAQLQFRLMTWEAQCAAVQRLALRGLDTRTISAQTGISEEEVRRYLTAASSSDAPRGTAYRWTTRAQASPARP